MHIKKRVREREREIERMKRRGCWICKERKLKDEGSTSRKRHEPSLKDKCALLDETENTKLPFLLCLR